MGDGWMDGYIDVDGEMYAWIQMEGGCVDRYMFGYRWMEIIIFEYE